jgi:ATP-GRASP peptide maturase of grasp-with-spasm system
MICVKSIPDDYSTGDVLSWLKYLDAEYVFLDKGAEEFSDILISNYSIHLKSESSNLTFDLSLINSFWYRRSGQIKINPLSDTPIINKQEIVSNIYSELSHLNAFIQENLNSKTSTSSIDGPGIGNLNRLMVFKVAASFGLKIPEYIITNKKKHLLNFFSKFEEIVLKPISNVRSILVPEGEYLQFTKLVSKEDLNIIPDSFFPSLFQEYIQKDFEIRTFFLDGKFYSMAIFSQKNNQTKIDFRKYDSKYPNVRVPFKLPEEIENKILKVFEYYNLNCGSVDILHTPNDEYVFLEINPVGQFGMVSIPCNYYLEKKIARTLIAYETKIPKETE